MLKLKFPPPLIFLCCLLLICLNARQVWGSASISVCIICVLLSSGLMLFTFERFITYKTTISPHHPEYTNRLITNGIFAYTRNPMYLALLLALIAFSFFWQADFPYISSVIFIMLTTYLQILPEEEKLREKFGQDYVDYCKRVPRWLIF